MQLIFKESVAEAMRPVAEGTERDGESSTFAEGAIKNMIHIGNTLSTCKSVKSLLSPVFLFCVIAYYL